ncbi:MAG: CopG family transcriptional regulator [Lachnospira sp.]
MGRPKLENPRSEGVFIRLTKDEHTDITEYASSRDLTITQTLVQGFRKLQEQDNTENE